MSVADQLRRKKDSLSKKNDLTTARKVERSTTGLDRDIPPAATLLNVLLSYGVGANLVLSYMAVTSNMWTSFHFSMLSWA